MFPTSLPVYLTVIDNDFNHQLMMINVPGDPVAAGTSRYQHEGDARGGDQQVFVPGTYQLGQLGEWRVSTCWSITC